MPVLLFQIISTYAPAGENKTESYIHLVTQRLNVSPDTVLELERDLLPMIKAITIFENGPLYASFYDDSTIEQGISLA